MNHKTTTHLLAFVGLVALTPPLTVSLVVQSPLSTTPARAYHALVTRMHFGIPHIKAGDYGSLVTASDTP